MTDREPDDFYDALRDRLADYGQEPPAPLWANVRAQLPPPVAAPQRRRQRRWAAGLGTLLVLLGIGMLGWWWQAGRGMPRPGAELANQAVPVAPGSPNSQAGTAAGSVVKARVIRSQSGTAGNPAAAAGTARVAVGSLSAPKPVAPQTGAGMPSPVNPPAAALGSAPAVATTNAGARRAGSRPAGTGPLLAAARAGNSRETQPAKTPATAGLVSGRGRTAIAPSIALVAATNTTALARAAATTAQAVRPEPGPISTRAATAGGGGQVASPASAAALAAGAPGAATRSTQTTSTAAATPAAGAPQRVETAGLNAGQTAETTTSTQAAWPPMELRTAALALASASASASVAAPPLLARADTLPPQPRAAVRRWAVQALAGPALTSRTLSAGRLSYAPLPNPALPPASNFIRNVSSNSAAENEQAAPGFGAEVQLQRQLSGRWSLGTGLGYHAFATNQTVNVRVMYSSPVTPNFHPDSVGSMSVRDTYHFLTLPLRVGYQLGAGPGRLRYGLRAGADVALYLGGRSTEGSSSRSWGASGSPYRPLSLALSLGAEVRYQLAPGWELVAQPTLTHFATSLARPASGYVVRYPLAASALVGVAWWLR